MHLLKKEEEMAKQKKSYLPTQTVPINLIHLPSNNVHVEQAIKMIFDNVNVDKKDLQLATDMINNIAPKNSIESIITSQAVSLHLKGMNAMHEKFINASSHGMMLLRLSQQAFDILHRYRSKNISICADEH